MIPSRPDLILPTLQNENTVLEAENADLLETTSAATSFSEKCTIDQIKANKAYIDRSIALTKVKDVLLDCCLRFRYIHDVLDNDPPNISSIKAACTAGIKATLKEVSL